MTMQYTVSEIFENHEIVPSDHVVAACRTCGTVAVTTHGFDQLVIILDNFDMTCHSGTTVLDPNGHTRGYAYQMV